MLPTPARVGPIFVGDIPPVEVGVRGSCVASGKVVSRRRSSAVDSALEEDVSGSSIGQRLRRKRNIDPLFAKSSVVIEIIDNDDPQAMETAGLHWTGNQTLWALTLSRPLFPAMPCRWRVLRLCVLLKGVVRVVDRIFESSEFALGIHRVKAACVAAGIEKGKKMAQAWPAGNIPGSSDPDAVVQSVNAMPVVIRAFFKTDFASYFRLGELRLANLRQLCSKKEEHTPDDGAASAQPRQV
ncbi:unnamed protein product [Lactuca virosa]|uniref:Uncharacterized protein n=1 Tax=Lactuca virosa TaxID=75947 RepID=A0AAU9NMJ7_9ASTR|nr:unnamed protein product [Lactuca virosa]